MSPEPGVEGRVIANAGRAGGKRHAHAFHACTHPGQVRPRNQDFAFADAVPGFPQWTLLVVADGVGGQARGEWASQLATETLVHSVSTTFEPDDPMATLVRGLAAANEAVFAGGGDDAASRPATTMVCAIASESHAWWANVGDSRIYLVRDGTAKQLSADHSWVAEQVRAGRMTDAEAAASSRRNVITRSIGFEPAVAADTGDVALRPGDNLVLCSDGVHGVVPAAVFLDIASRGSPMGIAEGLVEAANEAGAPDNATAVACCWGPAVVLHREQPAAHRERRNHRRSVALGLVAVAAVAGSALLLRAIA